MSIPYYDDLYSFPGGYPWQSNGHRCHSEHGLQPSYAQETGKSIDIYDKFGHLRYNVTLSSQAFYDSRCYKTIVSQTLPEGLVAFLEVPSDSWQEDYHRALEDFRACVAKYQSLVNAEMRDFKDIKVYKDQIDYRVQNTRCCDTCKWCMKTFEGYDHPCWNYHWHKPNSKVLKRQCCSPENEQVFNYARQYPQMPHWHGKSSWQKLPWQKPEDVHYGKPEWDPRRFPSIVFPVVDAMGICENYVSGECSYETFETRKNPVRRLAETIAPTYTVNLSCMPGDSVYYCGQLYECVKPHPGGMWDRQHFKLTTVDRKFKQVNEEFDRVDKKLDEADEKFADVDKEFFKVDKKFGNMQKELDKKIEPDEVSSMISSALSTTLVDYTTHEEVELIIEGDLVNYATKDDISAFTTSSDVRNIVDSSVSGFAKKSDLEKYAEKSSLSAYATKNDITGAVSSVMSSYALSNDVKSILSNYVLTTALSSKTMPSIPTQHQIAEIVKAQMEVLGGHVE